MRKMIFLFVLLLACAVGLSAQGSRLNPPRNNPAPAAPSKFFFGGGMGLIFGTYTQISVSPIIGYNFTPKISGGTRLNFDYFRDKRFSPPLEGNVLGASLFGRYRFIPQLYGHAEFGYYSFKSTDEFSRTWAPSLYLGGGFVQSVGGNTAIYIEVLFDVLDNSNLRYRRSNPLINIGVGVGL